MKRFVIGIAAALMVGALCGCDASVQEDVARLDIAPEPDSLLRVFMAWQPLDKRWRLHRQPLCHLYEKVSGCRVEGTKVP